MHAYMEISSWKGCNVGPPFLPLLSQFYFAYMSAVDDLFICLLISQYLIAVLGLLLCFFVFVVVLCRSSKRSRGSLRARPCYSVSWLEKSLLQDKSPTSRTRQLPCGENSQMPQNPINSRLWSNRCKVC